MSPTASSLRDIDAALRLVDRELWIVTSAHAQRRSGLLATWVAAASIDAERPVLLAGIAPNHFTAELVQQSQAFAAHLLRPDQIELAWNFASGSGRQRDKLAELAWTPGTAGVPLLSECLASFECRVFASFDAGDRLFFWGDVVGSHRPEQKSGVVQHPLREHAFFQALTSQQRQILAAAREADAQQTRPLQDRFRTKNPQ